MLAKNCDDGRLGDSYSNKFLNFALGIPTSCSILFTDSKTVFVFAVGHFFPFAVFGFNGNFNGKMTKINKMAKNHFSWVQMVPEVSKWGF